jgi:superfamily II DNA or RNA helicase
MLFWSLGSGKTVMALYYARLFRFKNLLVLCSKTLATQWREVVMGAGLLDAGSNVTIMTYDKFDSLAHDLPGDFPLKDFDLVVVDECHFYKNLKQAKHRSFQVLQAAPHLLLLTGTPLRNDIGELAMYQHLMGVAPSVIQQYGPAELEQELKALVAEPQRAKMKDHPALGVFVDHVSCFDPASASLTGQPWHYPLTVEETVRHHPRPAKNLEYIHVSGNNRGLRLSNDQWVPTWGRGDEMSRNGVLNSASKVHAVLGKIRTEDLERFPHVVFSMYRQFFPELRQTLKARGYRVALLTGEEHADERTRVRSSFLNRGVDVLLLCKVGGDGLDLPNARTLHVLEPQHNESEEQQVVGRVIRGSPEPYTQPVHILRYVSELPTAAETLLEVAEDEQDLAELLASWPVEVRQAVDEIESVTNWLAECNLAEKQTVEQLRRERNRTKAERLVTAATFLQRCSLPMET